MINKHYKVDGHSVYLTIVSGKSVLAEVPEEHHEKVVEGWARGAYACAVYVTTDAIEAGRQYMSQETYDSEMAIGTAFRVSIISDFFKDLTKDEVNAVIHHEFGHIASRRQSAMLMSGEVSGILMDLDIELEADRYAAAFCGRDNMLSALLKLRALNEKIVAEQGLEGDFSSIDQRIAVLKGM